MLYTIKVGIKTTSYCDVTIDAADLSEAGRKVMRLAENSETFQELLDESADSWDVTGYELVEGDNIGEKEPTFTDDYLEELVNEAMTNYLRKVN